MSMSKHEGPPPGCPPVRRPPGWWWRRTDVSPSRRAVLLLDVLAQDRDGSPAGPSRRRTTRTAAVPLPVVPDLSGEFLSQPAGGHPYEVAGQAGDSHRGREVHQQVHVVRRSEERRGG